MAVGLGLAAGACQAGAPRFCDRAADLSAAQKDKLFRFGAIVKEELERSGQRVALMSRSGLNLERFGVRYSHMGVSLQGSDNTPWSVRQLYYACDEQRPRVFDQGVLGFVAGTDDPSLGYLSVLLLPPVASEALERTALDKSQALQYLSPSYSANAYAFSERYQNCNQWLVELLAAAWGGADAGASRGTSQRWLQAQGYQPSEMPANPLVRLFTLFTPWLHSDDHPEEDLAAGVYRVNMPVSIEAFVRQREPETRRLEFCHTERQVVIHEGWTPVGAGCVPGPGDRVIALD